MQVEKLIIIGSGPAGYTAAIYAARAGLIPLLLEGSAPGGQLMGTTNVENWPGIKQILGPQLMQEMKEHAASFGTKMVADEVVAVNFQKKPFLIQTKKTILNAHSVIIATGATPKKLGCPGEKEYWGKGVSTCAVCDGAFYKNKHVVIVGGGDTAMEDASFMLNFTDKITIVHILDKLTASHAMQQRIINNPKIKIMYQYTVVAIKGAESHVTGITLKSQKTGEQTELETDAVFVAIGLAPNTNVFKDQIELAPNGYIILKDHTLTSVNGVFAAGDVADFKYRQAITSAGTGCMAALDAEKYLKSLENH